MKIFRSFVKNGKKEREFESVYLQVNPDVKKAVDERLYESGREHWEKYGKAEGRKWGGTLGRIPSRQGKFSRLEFSNLIASEIQGKVLEIGPLNRPIVTGPNVAYFDLFPTQLLREKASQEGLNPDTVPVINYSDSNGDLGVVRHKFEAVVSAHCIEHQPDLILHLNNVANLLDSGGCYFLVIPDSRYCFDHFISESELTEVVNAHREKRTRPDLNSVIEHRALTCHNEPNRHWSEDSGDPFVDLKSRWEKAEAEFQNANGQYIDVHCWQFSPSSFRMIIEGLQLLGLSSFVIEELYETPKNDLEFFAVLKKIDHLNP